ncbi:Serine/threonine protein kinase [Actinokineospora alba]|uniref:non-specific serine/threonine protein kinase n=1 Tax=Actinokineospora alba TaxID=504798 RepID=A0A1H0VJQ2_9PSEU|nr:serine/threonine protein kinase [Actinokineospora alba]TDP67696.1 serine/threonine protein kinase [Actinokineospora alba]SDJ28074.1 Serine/threonine protein kinase [Actinokineospora alba]SDP78296.1 Serine/threonine protein kinase [Actinokineospora alba]
MGARIVAVGEAVNDAERSVIAHLRDHAPDDWTVLHSLEIPDRRELFEVDLVVVTGHAVYVIDVKGTRGRIDVVGSRWHPAGRQPFKSPLPKLRGHAKRLKTLLENARPQLSRVYTVALVVLPGRDARLVDRTPDERDLKDTVTLANLMDRLSDASVVPTDRRPVDADISRHHDAIVELVGGTSQRPSGPLRFGNWQVIERLSESQRAPGIDVLDEYRAKNALFVQGSGTVRLSVRAADPYADERARTLQLRQIGIAFEALVKLPAHPHIVGVRDFFALDDDNGYVTVYDDVPGQALRLYLDGSVDPLTVDARVRTLHHILLGLAHAHGNRIVHREVSPSTVLIAQDGRALLTGFDYAKSTTGPRDYTVSTEAWTAAESAYLAPECLNDPSKMDMAADIYAVGVMGFELLTGQPPFSSATEQLHANGELPLSQLQEAGIPAELAHWLKLLCASDPRKRLTAANALRRLKLALGAAQTPRKRLTHDSPPSPPTPPSDALPASDEPEGPRDAAFYKDLRPDFQLGTKYIVRHRLGRPGSFGVAYRAYDTIRNIDRAVKLVLHDRDSPLERLRREASVLERLGGHRHPNVVAMVDADRLPHPDSYPYLVFEFVEGKDLSEVIRAGRLGPADVLRLGLDAAMGLAHIHRLGVWHCDIKPSNLLWTDDGVKLIDFGIAKTADSSEGHTHTSPRYAPPDLDEVPADGSGYADRDVYALGITLYEAITGGLYPWENVSQPPKGVPGADPRTVFSGLSDLAPGLVEILLRTIDPHRGRRFTSAEELLRALQALDGDVRVPTTPRPESDVAAEVVGTRAKADLSRSEPPNTNAYVEHLQTLYSQSRRSNRGTRGLDPNGMSVYVETALDRELIPALGEGKHALVVITGNAGDGKTAFIERFERQVMDLDMGARFGPKRHNGSDFTLNGRTFRTNHDGSQDEGDSAGDDVLEDFFAPYAGDHSKSWSDTNETRLIAINEGRLVDFLSHRRDRFPWLARLVDTGLAGGPTDNAVAVINLNARDVTVRPDSDETEPGDESILERMLDRMTDERFWESCDSCDLAQRCYALHNARTFSHPDAGPQAKRRLRRIYELTQLRGQLHVTLRDLRSGLAFALTSGRDCGEIHDLYTAGDPQPILDSFYFSSHLGTPPAAGGQSQERDRLLTLLRETDVAQTPLPQLDRRLDYVGLTADDRALITVDGRGSYDRELLASRFKQLARSAGLPAQIAEHRKYLEAARRLLYFELLDEDRAERMLPYQSALRFLGLLSSPGKAAAARDNVLFALNRGEGLAAPQRIGDALALKVRNVPQGTIRSYRVFPAAGFTLAPGEPLSSPYIESGRSELRLRYEDPDGRQGSRAELAIRLDLFEMLQRFEQGYRPGAADLQGRQLALAVFKNTLAAVPYQEILLTTHGHDLHRIRRTEDNVLHMADISGAEPVAAEEEKWR